MQSNVQPPPRIIHIHAKCKAFEIWEHVPEKMSVRRLTQIREYKRHYEDKLVVKTILVNPTLF